MKKAVIARFSFEGIHCWPKCNIEDVSFLRTPHRHIFHVKMTVPVAHNDRDVEIIMLKRRAAAFIASVGVDLGSRSCEDIAELLCNRFSCSSVEVDEDGENGAIVTND